MPALAATFALPPPIASRLTPAEQSVVRLVLTGVTNRAIAQARGSSEATVKHQLVSIYRKLGFESRSHLISSLLSTPLDCPSPLPN